MDKTLVFKSMENEMVLTEDLAQVHRIIQKLTDIVTDESLKAALVHKHRLILKAGLPVFGLEDIELKLQQILNKIENVDIKVEDVKKQVEHIDKKVEDVKKQVEHIDKKVEDVKKTAGKNRFLFKKQFYNLDAKKFNKKAYTINELKPLARLSKGEDLDQAIPSETILPRKTDSFTAISLHDKLDTISQFYAGEYQFSGRDKHVNQRLNEITSFLNLGSAK